MRTIQGSRIGGFLAILLTLCSLAGAAVNTWIYATNIPTPRTWSGGCVLDDKLYVIGGSPGGSSASSIVEIYDPIGNRWVRVADLPAPRCYPMACAFSAKIYVFGGSDGVWNSALKTVYVYDPQTDVWTRKADMPNAIALSGIAVVDSTIYLMGGTTGVNNPPVATVMAYDPATEIWTPKANMLTAREGFGACVVEGKIFAIGGCKQDWQTFAYKLVDVYDPTTDTWTRKQDMPTARWCLGVGVVDGKIHALGGNLSMQALTIHEVYDPAAGQWTTKAPMQKGRMGHYADVVGGKLYVFGGHYPNLNVVAQTEIYDTGLMAVSPDFNGDQRVDLADFSRISQFWGQVEPLADAAPRPFGDGKVDVLDLAAMADQWLDGVLPAGLWSFDGDYSAGISGHDGIPQGDPLLIGADQARIGTGAVDLDGDDGVLVEGYTGILHWKPRTCTAWIKTTGTVAPVVYWGKKDKAGGIWEMRLNSEGKLRASFGGGLGINGTMPVNTGQWVHIAMVLPEGSSRVSEVQLYVNGIRDPGTGVDGAIVTLLGSPLRIGANETGNYFTGLIDEVRIYDRGLSAEEVAALANP